MVLPYITFNGNCNEALKFYQDVFRSEVKMLRTYGEYIPEGIDAPPRDLCKWILHAEMEICNTILWFADDVHPVSKGNMIRLTATVPTAKEAKEIFKALSNSGDVTLPPVETFYSTFHGAVTDRYGVSWNIVAEEPPAKI